MDQQEILNTILLTRLNYFSLAGMLELYRKVGSATLIMEHKNNLRDILPDASDKLVNAIQNSDEARKRAEVELEYDLRYGIEPLTMNDERYPSRLKECDDAPLMLFYKGNANLNQQRVINIVGTRHCTPYGEDLIRRFITDLKQLCPQVLIVSGLAYGVDINAHRQALDKGYETVGVLAHGQDDLYPNRHKETALRMIEQGGLLTEFLTQTNADKINFVRRNRIVAGMSDACILVESAAHGGGLITCEISQAYNRDVFAFPGRIGDAYSEGCNNLIRSNGAMLITSASDFVKDMGWQDDAKLMRAKQQGIERSLFPDLSAEEQAIVDVLSRNNDLQINMISVQSGIDISRLAALLFTLEMKGLIRTLAGGMYHLLK
ncbi:DNA-processing protein DprA [Segatella hominis]|uniref:DNA-processing protein DprA n=1 Tax=Segatella hominis TaxID=2518605 RepID=UPI003F7FF50C